MIGFLLQLLYLPIRLVLLPFKLVGAASTFLTCVVPVLLVAAAAAVAAWFLFLR